MQRCDQMSLSIPKSTYYRFSHAKILCIIVRWDSRILTLTLLREITRRSIVVEIKAAEIIANSTSYAAQYTLRFPRFLHIREDKDAYSCMTLSEVYRMYKDFSGKLSTKSVDSNRSM